MADIQKPYDVAIELLNGLLEDARQMQDYSDKCISVIFEGKKPKQGTPPDFYDLDRLRIAMRHVHDTIELVRKIANSDDPALAESEAVVRVFKCLSAGQRQKIIELMKGFSCAQERPQAAPATKPPNVGRG